MNPNFIVELGETCNLYGQTCLYWLLNLKTENLKKKIFRIEISDLRIKNK